MDTQELIQSVSGGDLEKLVFLVERRDVDLNVRDGWDTTPLYYACLCGHEVTVCISLSLSHAHSFWAAAPVGDEVL